MIRATLKMLKVVGCSKVPEFLGSILKTIVRNNHIRYSVPAKISFMAETTPYAVVYDNFTISMCGE